MSTYYLPAPCNPDEALAAMKRGRRWTLLPEGEVAPDLHPVAMPLNFARVRLRDDGGMVSYSLANLVAHGTLDGTYWTWEPIDDPGGPLRIQRKRTAGWRKPDNTVIVDRTSRWGNRFKVADCIESGFASGRIEARGVVVKAFGDWLDGEWPEVHPGRRRRIIAELASLKGRDLACTCPVDFMPCHGDELIRRANGGGQ